jgi:CDP-diacylglycerol--serine O-phosphatidyltransferase
MGRKLDSLSDVVSFGVAPGIILYQLLRLSFAKEENGLDISVLALLPAFIFTAATAWRLAKFNISTNQTHSFRGVPSPAAGLLIASFPLILWYSRFTDIKQLFINKWALYIIILLVSYLMISNMTFMAMKFKDYSVKNNIGKYLLLAISLVSIIKIGWLAVPVIFVLYLLVSLFLKGSSPVDTDQNKKTLDLTV